MEFNPQNFIDSLQYMGKGMLGIFAVMGVIILAIVLLGHIFGRSSKSKEE